MAAAPETRPDPDALLAGAQKPGLGKLKIFIGASPGVGKTYAMLEEAQNRARAGVDVVIALVETHGRKETEAKLSGLEVLPRQKVNYRGQDLTELHLDALLARRPALAIIDELAHTNAPGSRHTKRWQDILEVLEAGIDVTTTINIQHIESLNDIVARITGVKVRETIPDEVLAKASEIELIDLPPDELIARLRAGKVYVPEQISRALDSFFNKGNLTALRELALRTAATRVDQEMITWMQSHAVAGPWPTHERLLVCINESPLSTELVRTAKRMADRAKIAWVAVTVMTPRHETLPQEKRDTTNAALQLAQSLGAEIETLRAESNAADELLAYARKRNVTRILVGRPRGNWLARLFREPVYDRLLDAAKDFEVTVVASQPAEARGPEWPRLGPPSWRPYLFAVAANLVALALCWALSMLLQVQSGSLLAVFLVGVLVTGTRHGLLPALFATVLSFLLFDFFFVLPYYSLTISSGAELEALLVFLSSAIFTGSLSARLKAQVESMRTNQRRTQQLYDFAKKIASVTRQDDVLWTAAAHIGHTLQCRSIIMMPDEAGSLQQVQGFPSIEPDLDARSLGAAQWAFERKEPAGRGTQTLPTGEWQFLPLATSGSAFGVIGVSFDQPGRFNDPEIKSLLQALEDQVAVAVERLKLGDELEKARLRDVGDRLREALLNSVSHDLRTPLVSVIGSLTALEGVEAGASGAQKALAEEALQGARRMDRYVQNLLNMTRLNHGAMQPDIRPADLREVIGQVRQDLRHALGGRALDVSVAGHAGFAMADPLLLGQALCNIIENAIKFSPADGAIELAVTRKGAEVVITVSDQGPGIPEAERDKVFDLFYRVASGDTQARGTGLGLAIVKGMIDIMGGKVEALPGPGGQGTSMVITLKAASDLATGA